MLFNSIEYLFLFLPAVFIIYFLLNKLKLYTFAKFFMLIASLYFYGSYKWDYVYIIICSILLNYFISFLFKKDIKNKKQILIFGILSNILILIFFKYFNYVIDVIVNLRGMNYLDTFKVIMPLGISFFTIQQISYIIDCYKEKFKEYNLLDYALYICFFPQLIAGPIVRHQEMIPQFNNFKNKIVNQENIFMGIFLLTIGLLKKTVFADEYVNYIDYITGVKIYKEFYIVWLLGFAKTVQVYFDFSGYCDMALGSALLFNIKLPWNFNSPFQAQSIIDYWKRWNMTLMRFLKDYLYKPLGGAGKNLGFKSFININILYITMGIWLGGSVLNILYGFVNGLLVFINELWNKTNIKLNKYAAKIITFISVVFTVQIMSVKNINELITVLKTMININNVNHIGAYIKGFDLIFNLDFPYNAKINIIILILSILIIFFSKNSTQLARLYVKSNNIIYSILLSVLFIFAVLTITRSHDFVYFIF